MTSCCAGAVEPPKASRVAPQRIIKHEAGRNHVKHEAGHDHHLQASDGGTYLDTQAQMRAKRRKKEIIHIDLTQEGKPLPYNASACPCAMYT